ncbi:hypothetical protein B5X24_HaOG214132 [Helicoverpa armigera]|uniref:Uncharacterized protein n=1 Tax=Helicoverpa armigera TaxID=29058 RepID=A0A2W1BE03_HELAM|nr:uncharacterized protein LOC110382845 [Helicoverpa armigera]PZC71100.1 hypothetical protein B5X24_HaOG214132 [Helicoverpa armigera]
MATQKTRPIDALHRIMSSFKQFEKKLDKLQDDVNFHGQTLTDLRTMVTNLSGGNIAMTEGKSDDNRRPLKKTAAIQYEEKTNLDDPIKTKRRNALQPIPTKLKVKSLQYQKPVVDSINSPYQGYMNKLEANAKSMAAKHALRHRKAEAPRKANTLRNQKNMEKKRNKLAK